jgi:hypothetical protein
VQPPRGTVRSTNSRHDSDIAALYRLISHELEVELGYPVGVIVRGVDDLQTLVEVNPGSCVIGTTDCRTDFERLTALGVQFDESEPIQAPYGVRVTAIDPVGNRIRLNQWPVAAATRPETTRAEPDGLRVAS